MGVSTPTKVVCSDFKDRGHLLAALPTESEEEVEERRKAKCDLPLGQDNSEEESCGKPSESRITAQMNRCQLNTTT